MCVLGEERKETIKKIVAVIRMKDDGAVDRGGNSGAEGCSWVLHMFWK